MVGYGEVAVQVALGIADAHGGGLSDAMADKALLQAVDVIAAERKYSGE